jgi:hypothetical protein
MLCIAESLTEDTVILIFRINLANSGISLKVMHVINKDLGSTEKRHYFSSAISWIKLDFL